MRSCPNCGAENEDNALRCVLCECELDPSGTASDGVPAPVQQPVQQIQPPQQANEQDRSGKSPLVPVLLAIIGVLLLGGGILAGVLIAGKNKEKGPENSLTIPNAAESASAGTTEAETTAETTAVPETTAAETTTEPAAEPETVPPAAAVQAKPSVSVKLKEEPEIQGVSVYMEVTGDFDRYDYNVYTFGAGSSEPYKDSNSSSAGEVKISAFSGGIAKIDVYVTPYKGGVEGDTVTATYLPGSVKRSTSVTACEKYGTIYSPSGNKVDGYAGSYLIDGGDLSYERHDLTNGWHIKAVNEYYDGMLYWYELYDADDGDYYGWVSAKNISFY